MSHGPPYRIRENKSATVTLSITVSDINDPMAVIHALEEAVSNEESPAYGWHLESFFVCGGADDDLELEYEARFSTP